MLGLRGALCCIAATLMAQGIVAQSNHVSCSHDRASWIESPTDHQAIFSPAVEERAASIASSSGAALLAEATAIPNDDQFDSRAKERLLYELIARMATLPEAVGERETLEALAQWRSEFTYMEPACRSAVEQPVFPIAAAARELMNERTRAAARDGAMELVGAGQLGVLIREASTSALPHAEGVVDAMMTVSSSDRLAGALLNASPEELNSEPVSRLLLSAATTQSSSALFGKLMRHGDERVALRGVAMVAQALDETSSVGVLVLAATERSELTSAALLELGRTAPNNERARTFLVSLLGHEQYGGSVAQSFAESGDRQLLESLASNLQAETDRMVQARLALTMHLWGDPAGEAALATFIERTDVDETLRSKVSKWVTAQ